MQKLLELVEKFHPSQGPHVVERNIGTMQQHARDMVDAVYVQTGIQRRIPHLSPHAVAGAYLTQRALIHGEDANRVANMKTKKAKVRVEALHNEMQVCMIAAMNTYPEIVDQLLGEEKRLPSHHPLIVARVLGRRLAVLERQQGVSEAFFQQVRADLPAIIAQPTPVRRTHSRAS